MLGKKHARSAAKRPFINKDSNASLSGDVHVMKAGLTAESRGELQQTNQQESDNRFAAFAISQETAAQMSPDASELDLRLWEAGNCLIDQTNSSTH